MQNDLFQTKEERVAQTEGTNLPLAYRARPVNFESYFGQSDIFKRYQFLKEPHFPSLILWGPPGSGKTSLAHVLSHQSDKEIYHFNAVLGGVKELKKLIERAEEMNRYSGKESIIFIDEIHRFNKAQQDALLPYVESGAFTLIGATTENPRSSVNKALLSRVHIIELKNLSEEELFSILKETSNKFEIEVQEEILNFIADRSYGDARYALNLLEVLELKQKNGEELSLEEAKKLINQTNREYDRNQNRHYDVISAFIKSMRGSDPNAALLWLAVMLDGGEDPVFIARRLVIFASEDIGNADPAALTLAVSALQAVQSIGMPEARINLSQATTYLASTVKSNAAYKAINEALAYVEESKTLEVPDHLKNFPPKEAKKYLYPHNYSQHFVKQDYTKEKSLNFYRPTEQGVEEKLKKRLDALWQNDKANH